MSAPTDNKSPVAVITGASRGIGRAIAKRLATRGYRVAVSSRNIQSCEAVVEEIQDSGAVAKAYSCDVRSEHDVKKLMDRVMLDWGALNVVISNAGVSGGNSRIIDFPTDKWNDLVATHLTGSFFVARETIRNMSQLANNDSIVRHLIFMSSLAAVRAHANKSAYTAVKGGIASLATAIVEEVRKDRINVSTIFPGSVATDILKASGDGAGKPMRPESVADAVDYITSIEDNALVQRVVLERREEV
ncbi:MAG: SDR family oxidoreductase [Planctomycetota bacterium]